MISLSFCERIDRLQNVTSLKEEFCRSTAATGQYNQKCRISERVIIQHIWVHNLSLYLCQSSNHKQRTKWKRYEIGPKAGGSKVCCSANRTARAQKICVSISCIANCTGTSLRIYVLPVSTVVYYQNFLSERPSTFQQFMDRRNVASLRPEAYAPSATLVVSQLIGLCSSYRVKFL